jgi:hypothetical protein
MFNHEDYETLQVTLNDLVSVDKKQAVYEPIPLTEEWLLKFGFEEWDKNAWQKGFDLSIHKIDSIFWYNNNGINVLIKYVHQLQNLCFALTGEELTLIEKP